MEVKLHRCSRRSFTLYKEAGVDLAMINYCFGSREELLYNESYARILQVPQGAYAVLRHEEIMELCGDLTNEDALSKFIYDNAERMLGDWIIICLF